MSRNLGQNLGQKNTTALAILDLCQSVSEFRAESGADFGQKNITILVLLSGCVPDFGASVAVLQLTSDSVITHQPLARPTSGLKDFIHE